MGASSPVTQVTGNAYACPNVATHGPAGRSCTSQALTGCVPLAGSRAHFAVESALDELSYTLGIDPIELRLRNYAEVDPEVGSPVVEQGTA